MSYGEWYKYFYIKWLLTMSIFLIQYSFSEINFMSISNSNYKIIKINLNGIRFKTAKMSFDYIRLTFKISTLLQRCNRYNRCFHVQLLPQFLLSHLLALFLSTWLVCPSTLMEPFQTNLKTNYKQTRFVNFQIETCYTNKLTWNFDKLIEVKSLNESLKYCQWN
jgi:hypothetical protein